MSDRFYVPSPVCSRTVQLAGAEAHHLLHVMRANVGTQIVLFDGTGREYSARVAKTTRRNVQVEVIAGTEVDRELSRQLILAVALPKGDRQSWLVGKAVELGVRQLVPLCTARSVAQPTANVLKRMRRAVIEASKQCGRNRLMEVAEPQPVDEYLRHVPRDAVRWIAHPEPVGESGAMPSPMNDLPTSAPGHVAVGPEGGFDRDEIKLAILAGWRPIWLGPRTLRVETAAIALAAVVACGEAWADDG